MDIKVILDYYLSKIYDFNVIRKIGKFNLSMNLSHQLPNYIRKFPNYSQNLGRIVKEIKALQPIKCIDVGANIGDSIAIIKNYCDVPVLGIEGDEKYLRHLDKNLRVLGNNVEIEKCFIGTDIGSKLERKGGTTRIVTDGNRNRDIKMKSLVDILKNHPSFNDFNFIKIDTDGFDTKIIKSSIDIISQNRPTIFFEYDPYFLKMQKEKGRDIFNVLENVGYKYVIFYDNFGDYITSCQIDNNYLIDDLHRYCKGKSSGFYYDLCMFSDEKIFTQVNNAEKEYFNKFKS